MPSTRTIGATVVVTASIVESPYSSEPKTLGKRIERAPNHAIERDDEDRHHGDAKHNARVVAVLGGLRNERAQSVRLELGVAPARDLRHNACIPRAARSRQRSRHIVW